MTIEVKIHCDCGTRYKFDVEPLHGRMPQKVGCPQCGGDGTMAANSIRCSAPTTTAWRTCPALACNQMRAVRVPTTSAKQALTRKAELI